jgi:hypothetical protein
MLRAERKSLATSFLPHGYVTQVHYPRHHANRNAYWADCCHIGSCSPYKINWITAIKRILPLVRLRVAGPGWRRALRGTDLEECVTSEPLFGDLCCRAIQRSRINLAFHYGPGGKDGWADFVSTRTFEIPAFRGFMLHIDNPEVRTLFEPDLEIGLFTDERDLCEKIEHYLARPELRGAMIERAYRKAVPAYSYDARAEVVSGAILVALEKSGSQSAVERGAA